MSEPEDNGERFSVWWWDPEGNYHAEARFIPAKQAVELAKNLTNRPAALIGIIKTIRIIDGGDNINFEWEFGKGVTFPPRQENGNDEAK